MKLNLTYDFFMKINKLGVQGVVCGAIDYNTLKFRTKKDATLFYLKSRL